MNKFLASAAALALCAGSASAGGIDRTLNPYSVLFEDGSYVELSYSNAAPEISGTYSALLTGLGGSATTGNMAKGEGRLAFAYKHAFTDQFSVALFQNQPYGARAQYTAGYYTGLQATWVSDQTALVGHYQFDDNWSVYGGFRSVNSSANIVLPTALFAVSAPGAGTYTASADDFDRQTGYIAGVAYEMPEIALRVALTYESEITHELATTESWNVFAGPPFGSPTGTLNTTTEITMPQSIKLDFQSGVAEDTLAFGMIRWSEWSKWSVAPEGYFAAVGDEITGFDNDVMTYQLGVARRFNDNLSGFVRATYEEAKGGVASRLAPTDGSTALGVGLRITQGNMRISTGVEYIQVGDAVDGSDTDFSDNNVLGFGFSIGMSF